MIDIEIVNSEPIAGGVQVFARAWDNGVQIGFGEDGSVDIERFRIFNPPVLVPDPNGTVEVIHDAIPELNFPRSSTFYREDQVQATLIALSNIITANRSAYGKGTIIPGKIGNTTSTVYSGAADEYVYANLSTWSGSYSSGGVGGSNTATILAAQASKETATYVIYRSPMPFDTSVIGTDTISSATINFTPQTNDSGGVDNQSICLDKVTTITPATGDYAISNWASVDQATRRLVSAMAVDVLQTMNLNATGISNINKTGTTNFGFRFSFDVDNTTPAAPASTMRTFPYASEQTGTTQDPYLSIVHAAASAYTPTPQMHLMQM